MEKVRITWIKSTIGCKERHRKTIQALGLKRRGSQVVKELTPPIKGMIAQVEYLLEVEKAD